MKRSSLQKNNKLYCSIFEAINQLWTVLLACSKVAQNYFLLTKRVSLVQSATEASKKFYYIDP